MITDRSDFEASSGPMHYVAQQYQSACQGQESLGNRRQNAVKKWQPATIADE
jgi:hypothetical protein